MTEQERLELVSAVEAENHDELDNLAEKLDDVDTSLRQAGSDTDDKVTIDVEVEGLGKTLTQLEALDDRLASIDDKDLDIGDGVEIPTPETPDGDGGADPGTAMTSGGMPRYDEIDPDAFTPPGVEIGGFSTPNAASDERSRELLALLDGEEEQFSPYDVGEIDTDDIIQMNQNRGLAAEGIDGDLGSDIIRAQRQALKDRGDESFIESLRDARKEFEEIRFTMSNFYDIFAALIPILGVFIGAIPAAITGIVALGGAALVAAGALAGIGALGAIGMSMDGTGGLSAEPIQEALGDIREEFIDTFAPLARTFTPFVNDALTEVETMLGPLATAASGLEMFTDEFAAMTSAVGETLPALVGMSLQFSSAVMPMLSELASYLLSQDIFGFMANQLAASLPHLVMLGMAFAEIIPAVIRLSQGFLMFASGLLFGVSMLARVINAFHILGPILGAVISLYLSLITASTLYSIVTGQAIKATLKFAAALVVKLASAIQTAIANYTAYTISTLQAYAATVALIGAVTLGVGAVAAMSGSFGLLSSNITDATKNLRDFSRVSGGLSNTSLGASDSGFGSGQRSSAYGQGATTIINAGDRDSANRQQYSSSYERNQHVDSVFGG